MSKMDFHLTLGGGLCFFFYHHEYKVRRWEAKSLSYNKMKSDSKRNLICCLCLYCTWAGLEEPRSWFCLSIYPGKQPNFSLSVIFKDPCADHFRKEHEWSCLLASDHWKKDERHLNLRVICCPAADRHMLKCTVKRRQYFGPFLGHSSLIIVVMLP